MTEGIFGWIFPSFSDDHFDHRRILLQYDRERWLNVSRRRQARVDPVARVALESEDLHYIDGIEKVLDWCSRKRLTVDWVRTQGGSYDPAERVITVSLSSVPRIQLQVLLHECGHHMIGRPKPGHRFSMGYGSSADSHVKKSDLHKIDILDEEFEAWERGWKLGRKLGALVQADRAEYNRYRVRMLKGYVNWAAGSW